MPISLHRRPDATLLFCIILGMRAVAFPPLLAECFGTFTLVFAGTAAIVIDQLKATWLRTLAYR